jgi:GNAT superfamily N-acetyltransferase
MLTIRQGTAEDKSDIEQLIMIILRQMELPIIAKFGEPLIAELLEQATLHAGFRYSYERAVVATVDDEVAGVIFGYTTEEEPRIDDAFQKLLYARTGSTDPLFVDSEIYGDEWYIDAIAVYDKYRGHGIGTKLLKAMPIFAARHGKQVIGLNVDYANPQAEKLYAHIGFTTVTTMVLSGHPYHHMYWNYENTNPQTEPPILSKEEQPNAIPTDHRRAK